MATPKLYQRLTDCQYFFLQHFADRTRDGEVAFLPPNSGALKKWAIEHQLIEQYVLEDRPFALPYRLTALGSNVLSEHKTAVREGVTREDAKQPGKLPQFRRGELLPRKRP